MKTAYFTRATDDLPEISYEPIEFPRTVGIPICQSEGLHGHGIKKDVKHRSCLPSFTAGKHDTPAR